MTIVKYSPTAPVPANFLPHGTLAKHGAAYVTHNVGLTDVDATMVALRKAETMLGVAIDQIEKIKHMHAGVESMQDLCRKAQNACKGLTKHAKLYSTQLGAAQGALTLAAQTLSAASALICALGNAQKATQALPTNGSKVHQIKG